MIFNKSGVNFFLNTGFDRRALRCGTVMKRLTGNLFFFRTRGDPPHPRLGVGACVCVCGNQALTEGIF